MKNGITVYFADASCLEDEVLFGTAYKSVSQERRSKVDRFKKAEDKYLSLAAELLLIFAMKENGFFEIPEYDYTETGKPFLKNHGSFYFNLSHSGKMAVCTVSNRPVGCDIEKLASADMKLAERFFCKGEYESIKNKSTQNGRDDMFFRLWTLKESFIKAIGAGLSLSLNKFEIIIKGSNISVKQDIDGNTYYFNEIECISGYKCAVCSTESSSPLIKKVCLKEILTTENGDNL